MGGKEDGLSAKVIKQAGPLLAQLGFSMSKLSALFSVDNRAQTNSAAHELKLTAIAPSGA
jgi:hypothetical protein